LDFFLTLISQSEGLVNLTKDLRQEFHVWMFWVEDDDNIDKMVVGVMGFSQII
jgi:hypothetical protein